MVIPSFENLCLEKRTKGMIHYNEEHIKIEDIRILLDEDRMFFFLESKNYIINEKYKNFYEDFILNKGLIKEGIIEIIKKKYIITSQLQEEKIISKEDFFKKITNMEQKALYSIIKDIGEEGNITISKLVEKNNISRPVYNNLISKMKENNIAEIENQGMKGTYIKIIEPELKLEAKKGR